MRPRKETGRDTWACRLVGGSQNPHGHYSQTGAGVNGSQGIANSCVGSVSNRKSEAKPIDECHNRRLMALRLVLPIRKPASPAPKGFIPGCGEGIAGDICWSPSTKANPPSIIAI